MIFALKTARASAALDRVTKSEVVDALGANNNVPSNEVVVGAGAAVVEMDSDVFTERVLHSGLTARISSSVISGYIVDTTANTAIFRFLKFSR